MVTTNPPDANTKRGRGELHAHIVGWGMAVPDTVLTNDDLAAFIDTSDEWIYSRTGIRARRIANERESTSTLGLRAARRALAVANILPDQLNLVIVATSTPENIFPSTASLIQDWLGASNAGAFDLSAACSGFVYAVQMAAQAIRSGSIQTALVIGAETMSRVMDWQDRSTCVLFGDGAGAIVLTARETPGGILSAILRSNGAGHDFLTIPTVGSLDIQVAGLTPNGRKMHKLHMDGGEVFRFAARVVGESVRQAVAQAGIRLQDLKLIVPHQANERILQAVAKSLNMDTSLFMSNIAKYGNTSAASIPIALVEAVEQGRIHPGDHIAIVGFGGGLAWAAMVIQWSGPQAETRFGEPRRQAFYLWAGVRRAFRQFTDRLLRRRKP